MFGGTPSAQFRQPRRQGHPDRRGDVDQGAEKNIKWSVRLGSKAYGGPIVAGGKIYIGTNNDKPRDPTIKGDKGVLMCFDEADGKFLWQAVHDKLLAGRVNDWPYEGICSSPVVEGNRLYYVSNRCEVICAMHGRPGRRQRGVTDEKYKSKTDADIIWRLDMIKDLGVFPHNLVDLLAADRRRHALRHHQQRRRRGPHQHSRPRTRQLLAVDKKTAR